MARRGGSKPGSRTEATARARAHIQKRAPLPGHIRRQLWVYAPEEAVQWFRSLGSRGMGEIIARLYEERPGQP
jgi:hypothetical protein